LPDSETNPEKFRTIAEQASDKINTRPRNSALTLTEKSMSLGPDDVKSIAHLARLDIEEKNIERYANSLSSILDLVEQMNEVDTTSVQPMAHPMDVAQRLRADEVLEVNQREAFQKIAPRTEDGLYLVPKVIE